MNGVHDLGGMDGFGAVDVEAHEPVFHARWEARVFALAAAVTAQRLANVHAFRHAIERMEPLHYLGSSYYEHWLTAIATLLVERGVVSREELDAAAGAPFALSRPVRRAAEARAVSHAAGPARDGVIAGERRDANALETDGEARTRPGAPCFAVGDVVAVRNRHPLGHTRCPRYARGSGGTVVRVQGVVSAARRRGALDGALRRAGVRRPLRRRDALGRRREPGRPVHVDLWESYLEAP